MVFSAVVKKASRVGAFFVSALLAAELAAQCPAPGATQAVRVTRVVDGDTLHLADGRKARLIGLNAPELGRRGQAAQPFAEQARARREQIEQDLAELDGQLEDLQERRITAEGRFEELDLQLADGQERQLELEDRAIEAERRLAQAREQLRSLERQAQEATFSERSLQARRSELQRGIETAR